MIKQYQNILINYKHISLNVIRIFTLINKYLKLNYIIFVFKETTFS